MLTESLKNILRTLIYPGLDLHTRNRAALCRYWGAGPRQVLDAGSGNGYFSWLAYRSGAHVVAMNAERSQLEKARRYLIGHRGADPARLMFEEKDLRELDREARVFDEVICYEVLEHIVDDGALVRQFFRVLKPGGVLHLCCPYRLHPRHQAEVLDLHGGGGHVRAGYTEDDYRKLLEPEGFVIERCVGIGPWPVYASDALLRSIRSAVGDVPALPLLPLLLPLVGWAKLDPDLPFSLYVTAVKPHGSTGAGA